MIVKDTALETMFVDESKTVTEAFPGLAISEAGTIALSCVALTNVVVSALLFQRTTDVASKLPPFTVSVKPEPPCVSLEGKMEAMSTTGNTVETFKSHTPVSYTHLTLPTNREV